MIHIAALILHESSPLKRETGAFLKGGTFFCEKKFPGNFKGRLEKSLKRN